jgi:hypothetical protein
MLTIRDLLLVEQPAGVVHDSYFGTHTGIIAIILSLESLNTSLVDDILIDPPPFYPFLPHTPPSSSFVVK